MQHIDQTYTINAPVEKVWWALTTAEAAEQWGAGPAKFDSTEGGEFSYWDGDIHGANTKVIPNQLLEQDWYGHDRPEHCYKVRFSLTADGQTTTVHLEQPDVPEEEYQDMEAGWPDYYFTPIKKLLES
ncbi:MAG TPA: SRPBCC domain-containing protein [Candidatus Saccharimonadales bacterium]|nr:SRPBCC domain-containing protein [Candidatus Saccharimonadales bacterium]